MPRPQVIDLPASRLDEAAGALAAAFMDDPLQSYTFPDRDQRRRLSPPHFGALLRYGLMAGHVLTSAEAGGGASVWMSPDAAPTDAMFVESGLSRLDELLGAEAARRFGSVIDFIEPFHKTAMPEPHWYVMVIGVAPAFQGHGLGRALLQPMLDRADTDQVPCYLETTQPKNVTFYQRLGFRVVEEVVEPSSGLRIWTFRRDSDGTRRDDREKTSL
jgi:ribosomal protein S18 acetylase RimI-like enzyme